jgi:hypothetical protein
VPARRYPLRIDATMEVPTIDRDLEKPDRTQVIVVGENRPRDEPVITVGDRVGTCLAIGFREAVSSENSVY